MGGVVSAGVDNDELVDKLKEEDYIRSKEVEKAFRLVDRGYYFTQDAQNEAYKDSAWKYGHLHLSAPCIYAQVMEGLDVRPGMSFLNIGSGTGYLSTMVGLIIGPFGINHGVELHSSVIAYARERLDWFLLNSGAVDVSFLCEPQFSQGNALCFRDDIPRYDRIYCGASCPSSYEDYMKNLVKINGILVMPRSDKLVKITRTSETTWSTEALIPASFASLIVPVQTTLSSDSATNCPSIRIPLLQEIAREIIRSTCRSVIEQENQDFLTAFTHKVPENQRLKSNITSRPNRALPHVTISESNYDREASSDEEMEGSPIIYTARRLHANQLSAFMELAETLAMTRRIRNAEAVDESEADFVNPAVENDMDMEIDDDIIDENNVSLALHEEQLSESASADMGNASPPESLPPVTEILCSPEENISSSLLDKSIFIANAADSKILLPVSKNACTKEKIVSPNINESFVNDINDPSTAASSELPQSSPSCSISFSPYSSDQKKRDKFDSGFVEDVDSIISIEERSSSNLLSFIGSDYEGIPTESDEVNAKPPSSSPNQTLSPESRCSTMYKLRNPSSSRRSRYQAEDKVKRTIKYENWSRIDSKIVIDKYSDLMTERLRLLPLPSPLKFYVNFCRPL